MNGCSESPATAWTSGTGEFQRFCGDVAEALGADHRLVPRISAFLTSMRRLPLVWFQFGSSARCGDTFARCTDPWAGEMVFAQLPAEPQAARSTDVSTAVVRHVASALRSCAGKYLCVVEGAPSPRVQAIPGVGRMLQIASDVCGQARAVLCVGPAGLALNLAMTSAAAAPVLTDALGLPAVHVPGSPPTAVAFAATLVTHLLGAAPSLEPTRTPPPSLRVVRP
jgi:Ni,Fe-hydrogenase I small subunit